MSADPTLFDATQNRDAVFHSIQKHLSEARAKVLIALCELGTATDEDIKEKLDWEINRVTGRRGELCGLRLIEKAGEEKGPYRQPRTIWKVNEMQLNYFLTQKREM